MPRHFRNFPPEPPLDRTATDGDTIAAVASPAGTGAISLIRISGVESLDVLTRLCGRDGRMFIDRRATRAVVQDDEGRIIDDVLVTVFLGPRSFTGEDVVEIAGHGGMWVTRKLLERILACGARAAAPGEFSQRAFFHGKLDLAQAEAIMDLIAAQSDLAMRAAHEQLAGRLGDKCEELRANLLGVVAHLEAYIDFPEEDIDPEVGAALIARIEAVRDGVQRLLATADQGRILREGVRTVIYGAPNVGKSSLLNTLVGHERAIVSEEAGTTRDTVEEWVRVGGIPLRLIDTAGVRETTDRIEAEGVRRSERQRELADLVLEVFDASKEPPPGAGGHATEGRHHLVVLNKCDLPEAPGWNGHTGLRVSCNSGAGVDELIHTIRDVLSFGEADWGDHAVAVNARHQQCLQRAAASLERSALLLEGGMEPEFVAVELREGLDAIGEISGRVDTEEILGSIFSQFCIGK